MSRSLQPLHMLDFASAVFVIFALKFVRNNDNP